MSINIDSIKRRLLVKYPAFGSIIANATFKEVDSITTASTTGKDILYNREFVEKLNSDEQVFLFAHEVCHIAFDHILRSENRIHKLWNIATDAVINASLKGDGLPLIEGVVDMPDAINYNAEDLYEKLLKDYNEEKQKENNNSGNDEGNSNGDANLTDSNGEENENVGHDDHTIWKRAIEKKKEEDENNEKNDSSSKKDDEIKENVRKGEKKTFEENKKERKRQLQKMKDELVRESQGIGNSAGEMKRNINNVGVSKPLINWKMFLRDAIKQDFDWSYRNATVEYGVLTPHLEGISIPETEILLDTSGSIDESLLRNFLRECKNILHTSKVKVGCFDTKFYGFYDIRKESDIETIPLEGGGGTDFEVAVDAFTDRVENKIVFTDGEAYMPKKYVNAIWIVFGGKKINPPGGKVIYISYEDLKKLSDNSYGRRR